MVKNAILTNSHTHYVATMLSRDIDDNMVSDYVFATAPCFSNLPCQHILAHDALHLASSSMTL